MKRVPHVALLIETSRSYGRGLLRGVRQYVTQHGPWSVFIELRSLDSKPPPWLRRWKGDGILTRSGSQEMANAVIQAGVPAVELRATRLRHPFPFVGVDNHALGRKVAEHLLERGFRHFGVYDLDTEDYFKQRRDNFIQTICEAGYEVSHHGAQGRTERPAQWERQQDDLARWLTRLPKPVGLMACTDQMGFWLLDACSRAGVTVPEEAAIVGVENDETLCNMALPPLSSVPFNAERIGYEAAALLDRMMAGKAPPTKPIFIEPLEIVTRQSSDIVAIEDEEIATAVRFIRQHGCEGITVRDILKAVPISRSSLERRMRMILGRSPKAEIARIQINRVKTLLAESDLSMSEIAERAGFTYPQYMCGLFRRKFGKTPGDYRRQARTR
jgi:LacI family transcriptional regulator